MAVRRLDLETELAVSAPALELAPPPPTAGHPIAAGLVVLALVAALGLPIARSSSRSPDAGLPRSRALPIAAMGPLDALPPMSSEDRPKSSHAIGGVAFVSCTRLWLAQPDGTHARKLVELPGLSSPAFAPSGRSIAFVRPGRLGDEIWMMAADGSDVRPVGALTSGGSAVDAHATGLAWSKDGDTLAFALVDGRNDPWVDGSVIYELDLRSGEVSEVGPGYPTPLWDENRLAYPAWSDRGPAIVGGGRYGEWMRVSDKDEGAVLMGADVSPPLWFNNYKHGAVVLQTGADGDIELVVKNQWRRQVRASYAPPTGHDFVADGQPALSQDGTRAFVDIVDRSGERDLGVIDLGSGKWKILDYAWDPTTSPAPATTDELTKKTATTIFEALLSGIGNSNRTGLLGLDASDVPVEGGRRYQFAYQGPFERSGAWRTTATLIRWRHEWAYKQMDVSLRQRGGRVVASIDHPTSWTGVQTPEDAYRFTEAVLGHPVPRPTIPAGLELVGEGPVNAWTWSGLTTVSLSFAREAPGGRAGRPSYDDYTTISYGSGLALSMGCGGSNDPEPIDLGGPPAMADHMSGMHAIVWPATPDDTTNGNFSVSGDSSADEIEAIARSMVTP